MCINNSHNVCINNRHIVFKSRRNKQQREEDGRHPREDPAAEFVVYFALGSSVLEAEALETLEQVAADAQDRPAPDIELLGFADRAGDDQTNLALSGARIEAVRQALLALGAPEDAFLVYARGEAAPAVNTADGVAERRNRRVEITVR